MRHFRITSSSITRIFLLVAGMSGCLCLSGAMLWYPDALLPETNPYVLRYPANFGNRFTLPADNPLTQEGVYLGRALFYEPALSASNTLSCASCHRQELAFTDTRALSQGVDGTLTRRNAMSLSNLLWVRSFFWDGRANSLESQALVPLTDPHEMGQSLEESATKLQQSRLYPSLFQRAFGTTTITGNNIIKALAQFERTLISADAPYDRYLQGSYQPAALALEGLALFARAPAPEKNIRGANCAHCHGGPKTFLDVFHNNGLDSVSADAGRYAVTAREEDHGRFRVPTLRNIALTAPYMHDGRFNTLKEVLDHYSQHVKQSPTLSPFIADASNGANGRGLQLTEREKDAIVAFLKMLTDSTFITNPAFSDPHIKRN